MAERRHPQGFTLIEMMVALGVFSLAGLALVRLEGATIRSAATLDATMLAQMVARNVAVEALTDARPPTSSGGNDTNGGRSWQWQRLVAPIGDQGAIRIDVIVADAQGTTLCRLTVIRPPAVPPREPRRAPDQALPPQGGRT